MLKSQEEIAIMREAGDIVARVLEKLASMVEPGVTTAYLDAAASRESHRLGAEPSFKGYGGFPASLCTSINDVIVHGIPDDTVLKEGDVISLDFGVAFHGFQGDAATTVGVGHISDEAEELIRVTRESLFQGIAAAKENRHVGDISAAVQRYAESRGYAVIREYTGHGIGRKMHEDPPIPNFGWPGTGPRLLSGMTLAIEPMLAIGDWHTRLGSTGWPVLTANGKLAAHFEHTIAITSDGPEILTVVH